MVVERLALVLFAGLIASAAFCLPVLEDEAYYWAWSRTLALHYFDHPPLIAWLIRGAQSMVGDRFVACRLVSLSCMLLTAVGVLGTTHRLTQQSAGSRAAAAWALAASLLFAVALLAATPDAPLAATLAGATYALVRALQARPISIGWSALAGALLGLAALAKLSAGLVALGVVVGLALHPEGRRALARPALWLGVAVGGALFAAWWWSAPDLPPAVAYQWSRVTSAETRGWISIPMTLGGAVLVVGVAVTVALLRDVFRRRAPTAAHAALLGAAVLSLMACTIAVAIGSGELNWLLPVLVCGIPPTVAGVGDGRGKVVFRWAAILQAVVVAAVLVHIVQPVLPIPAAQDRTLRSAGWSAVAAQVDFAAQQSGARALVTRRYQNASLLRFHLGDRWPVVEHGGRASQYDLWNRPALCRGDRAIVLVDNRYGLSGLVPLARTREIKRMRAGRTIERLYLTPVRVVNALDPALCRNRPRG